MRQLWLDNEVLDENGVRNYMSNAKHTQEGARLRNITTPKDTAQQDVDVMGSFQVSRKAVLQAERKAEKYTICKEFIDTRRQSSGAPYVWYPGTISSTASQ